jgi:hypothetical protein
MLRQHHTPPPKQVTIRTPFSSPTGGASVSSSAGTAGVLEAWVYCPAMFGVETTNIFDANGFHTGMKTSVHNRFMVDAMCCDEDFLADWEDDMRTLHIERVVPEFYANPNNQDDYIIDEVTKKPAYKRTDPLLGSMAASQEVKKVDDDVISPGKIVYGQDMDPDSVMFFLQPMDSKLGNGQVLVVVADVFVPKEVRKGKIKAKKRTNVATVKLGTLVEDFEMLDASDDPPPLPAGGVTAAGTTTPQGDTATAMDSSDAVTTVGTTARQGDINTIPLFVNTAGTAASQEDTTTVETPNQRSGRQKYRATSPRRRRSKRNQQLQLSSHRASPSSSSVPPIRKDNILDDDDDNLSL